MSFRVKTFHPINTIRNINYPSKLSNSSTHGIGEHFSSSVPSVPSISPVSSSETVFDSTQSVPTSVSENTGTDGTSEPSTIENTQNTDVEIKNDTNNIDGKKYPVELDTGSDMYTFQCPQCDSWTQVPSDGLNCKIFRHAHHFVTRGDEIILTTQLNPHAPKELCEKLLRENKVIGCAKPFKIIQEGNIYYATKCEYI